MNYNKTRHIELEKRSMDFINMNTSLFKENKKEYKELNKYRIMLFDNLFWLRKNQFVSLMEKFINDSIDIEQFEIEFSLLYQRTNKAFEAFKKNLKLLEKLQLDPRSYEYEFSRFIVTIFRMFETLEDEECTEQNLKDSVKTILFRIDNLYSS